MSDAVTQAGEVAGNETVGQAAAVLALKEWAAVVHALLDGRQTVLLRKGGIHEKRFSLQGSRFVVFPTVAHSHLESTRPEHAELLPLGESDVLDVGLDGSRVVVRAELEVIEAIAVRHPDRIAALEQFHIWTSESVRRNRIDFRPRHELSAIVVRARPLTTPVIVPVLPAYAGCRSWVDLDPVPFAGVPVLEPVQDDATLLSVAEQVRLAVG